MKKYYYLSQLGIPKEEQMGNWIKRQHITPKIKKNLKKYGINDMVVQNFDNYYMDFIYIHIKRYYKLSKNIINLKFNHVRYKKEEYDVESAIKYILNWFECGYYGRVEEQFNDIEYVNTFVEERQKVLHLIAEIIPYLNW